MGDVTSLRVGYLGPSGTFTESALLTQTDLASAEHVLYRSHSDVLHNTSTGEIDFGFCAIENAIEGTVNVVQDTLAFDSELLIQRGSDSYYDESSCQNRIVRCLMLGK